MEPTSQPLPFVPDEMLFVLPSDGSRDLEVLDGLAAAVQAEGGALDMLAEGARALDEGGPALPTVLSAGGLGAHDRQSAYDLFERMDARLRAQGSAAHWQPNWLAGAASNSAGGGSGAGPGARPMPLAAPSALPLRPEAVEALRGAAAQAQGTVHLVFLDAWNSDHSETRRHLQGQAMLRLLNDFCRREGPPLPQQLSALADPFPMPDHGLFAAHLAASVIGSEPLRLHDSLLARLGAGERADYAPGERPCISLDSIAVLDEQGTGDSKRLIHALLGLAERLKPEDRLIVNMSLVVTIPDYPLDVPDALLMARVGHLPPRFFRERLPWNIGAGRADRLDRALYEAIRTLHERGALLLAAAGNASRGDDERYTASYPARYDEVVDVTAATVDGTGEAWYANRASPQGLALFAGEVDGATGTIEGRYPLPGPFSDSAVPILGPNDPPNQSGAVAWAGTSFAAPLASGLAALLWAGQPTASADDIRAHLTTLAAGRSLAAAGTPFIDLLTYP